MAVTDLIRGRQVVIPLLNSSGGGVIAGDVVIINTAANDSFTTTTSAASTQVVGIAQETIASAATGRILIAGYAPLVNVSASATRGHFLFTHTVAKQATSSAVYASGAFGEILTAGTTPTAYIFGLTSQGAGFANPLTTTGDIIYSSSGTTAARLAIGATAGNILKVSGGIPAWAFPTFFGCRVYNNANISITGGANTIVTFNSENYDQGGYHDTGSNTGRLTIPAGMTGYYNIFGALYWATNGTAYIRINGNDNLQIVNQAPAQQLYGLSGTYALSAGDYVEMVVNCSPTQNLNNLGVAFPAFGLTFLGV